VRILTGIDVPFKPFGGSLLCANDWYSNLPEDVEVRFMTLPPPEGIEKWWTIEDVVMLDIEKVYAPEAFRGYVDELKKLVQKQIDDFKPDIIHCQHLNYGLSRAITELQLDIPLIGICHGTDAQIATQYPFFKDNLDYICDNLDLLVFPNETMKDDFFKVYGKEKSYVINALGIPDQYFEGTQRGASFDGKRQLKALYAGRLLAWKGTDIAVESMKYISNNVSLTVIGNEDQKNFKDDLLTFVKANQLENRVSFKNQLPRNELLTTFLNYDVIVFPSRSLEAFSLTVVEAQVKGLPVIFNPGGGITDTVGNAGIIITENTPEGLAKLLDAVYKKPEMLVKMRNAGYENAEKYRASASQARLFTLSKELIRSN
jgi:glycosyltransferase involved in cell wall biosynthesis